MATLICRSNGIDYIITKINGRRVSKSTGCTRKSGALKYIVKQERNDKKTSEPVTLRQFRKQLLAYVSANQIILGGFPQDLPDSLFPQTVGESEELPPFGERNLKVIISCVEPAKYDLIVINRGKKECVRWNNREKDVIRFNWEDFRDKGFPCNS